MTVTCVLTDSKTIRRPITIDIAIDNLSDTSTPPLYVVDLQSRASISFRITNCY